MSIILMFVLLVQLVSAGTVTRSFNPATAVRGQPVVVTLNVDVQTGDTFYVIEENIPAGWTVSAATPAGDQNIDFRSDPRRFLVTVLNNPVDTVYTYTVTAPTTATSPTAFTGQVGFSVTSIPIAGTNSINVVDAGAGSPRACTAADWLPCSEWDACTTAPNVNLPQQRRTCTAPATTICRDAQAVAPAVIQPCVLSCTARAPTCAQEGVGCPGNTVLPRTQCPSGQTCNAQGQCALASPGTCPNGAVNPTATPPCTQCPSGQELIEVRGGTASVCDPILRVVRDEIRAADSDLSLVSRIAAAFRSFLTRIFPGRN